MGDRMTNRLAAPLGLILGLCVAGCGAAPGVPAPAAPVTLAFTDVHLVDVEEGRILRDRTVLVGGNRILAVGPAAGVAVPPTARVVDGRGRYLIPGLIDTHVHLAWDLDSLTVPATTGRHLLLQALHGVTTVREASTRGLERQQLAVRDAPARSGHPTPRVYVSGRIDPANIARYGACDARDLARQLIALGVDGLKVRDGLALEDVRGVLAEARAAGVPVYGHVYAYPREAVGAGIDGVMHVDGLLVLPPGGHPVPPPADTTDWAAAWLHRMSGWLHRDRPAGDSILRSMAARGVWLEPTLLVFDWIAEPDYYRDHPSSRTRGESYEAMRDGFPTPAGEAQAAARAAVAELGRFIARFHELGGIVLAGTDLGRLDGLDLHEELRLLARSGLPPAAALQAATIHAARALGWDDRIGSVREGKLADLVLLDANPLEDLVNTRRIQAVVLDGVYLGRGELDRLLRSLEASSHVAEGGRP
jgi:cytosine/adenosine deaminase-related metal-dependent hydrolase